MFSYNVLLVFGSWLCMQKAKGALAQEDGRTTKQGID
jgi:hypothetical protein